MQLTERHASGTVMFLKSTEPRFRFGIDSELGRKTSLISLPYPEIVSDLVAESELPILILNHFPSLEPKLVSRT